jgi:hypothetical protein
LRWRTGAAGYAAAPARGGQGGGILNHVLPIALAAIDSGDGMTTVEV